MGAEFNIINLSAEAIFAKLDEMDNKKDGFIQKNIWDGFASLAKGNTIDFRIARENAIKSINKYLERSETNPEIKEKMCNYLNGSASTNGVQGMQDEVVISPANKAVQTAAVEQTEPVRETKPVQNDVAVGNGTVTRAKVKKMIQVAYKEAGITDQEKLNNIDRWTNLVYENATKYNVEPEIIIVILKNECCFNINIKESNGNYGIMQINGYGNNSTVNDILIRPNYYEKLDKKLYNEVVYENGVKLTKSEIIAKLKDDPDYSMKVGILVYKAKAANAGNSTEKAFLRYNTCTYRYGHQYYNKKGKLVNYDKALENCKRLADKKLPEGLEGNQQIIKYNNKLRRSTDGETTLGQAYAYSAMRLYHILKASV